MTAIPTFNPRHSRESGSTSLLIPKQNIKKIFQTYSNISVFRGVGASSTTGEGVNNNEYLKWEV
jgi:hypothetical protein